MNITIDISLNETPVHMNAGHVTMQDKWDVECVHRHTTTQLEIFDEKLIETTRKLTVYLGLKTPADIKRASFRERKNHTAMFEQYGME